MHSMARCAGCQAELPPPRRGEPLPRLATCPACHAELHACRQCRSHDAGARRCRNPHVDEMPTDQERSNFCDYFELLETPPAPPGGRRNPLDDLFGACR